MDMISIIVPVYNVEKYIHQCVDSIINQTYSNIEIILVDDGSPDNCGKICDEYAARDSRIKVIHKANGGLSDARNYGIDAASGEWLMFVDSDDWIEPDMAEKLYYAVEKENTDLACANIFIYDNETAVDEPRKWNYSKYEVITNIRVFKELYGTTNSSSKFVSACFKLFKRNVFDNIRFPIGRYHEDAAVFHLVFDKCSKIVCVPDCLYHYRIAEGSLTHREPNIKFFDLFYALKAHFDYYVRHNLYDYTLGLQDSFYAYLLSDYYRYSSDKNNRKKLREFRIMALQIFPYYFKRKDIGLNQKIAILIFCLFPNLFKFIFKR